MKSLCLGLALSLVFLTSVWSQCPPNGISTNPSAPINTQLPIKKNNYFDWRLPQYASSSYCYPHTSVPSPFYLTGNLEILRATKDYKVEDGWELIDYDFGYDINNIPRPVSPQNTHVILYNKLTGILRIIMKTCRKEDYNGVRIAIKFDATSKFQTSLLDNISELKPLDAEFKRDPMGQAPSRYLNDDAKWFYADFPTTYDPCTCKYESKISIISELIKNSQINLEGAITGTITTINNSSGSVNSNGQYSFKDFVSDADKFKTVNESLEVFLGGGLLAISNLFGTGAKAQEKKAALTLFANGLKDKSFLKNGLNAVPWLKEALSLFEFFSGGGNSSAQANEPVKLQPMSVNLAIKMKGTMQSASQYHNIILSTPGSLNAQNDPDIYPYYNEALGVFSLINGPEFEWNLDLSGVNDYDYNPFIPLTFKLARPIKWSINPASDLQIQDAKVCYVAVSNMSDINPPLSLDAPFTFIESKDALTGTWQYRTEYVDINCLGNDHSFSFNAITGNLPIKYYMKFILNLKRISNPSAQNVPLVLTYPIKVGEELTTIIPYQEFNPLACAGGMIQEASTNDITAFCTSAGYKRNREFRISQVDPTQENTVVRNVRITPNPARGNCEITGMMSSSAVKSLQILDMTGRLVKQESVYLTGTFAHRINLAQIPPGMYIATMILGDGKKVSTKLVITQ
jgi:hypothetical protein